MLRRIRRRLDRRTAALRPLSALTGDLRADLWPLIWLLRYAAGVLIAVGLALDVSSSYRIWAITLPLVGVVACLPVQALARKDPRWGTVLLVTDCLGVSITALALPEFYPLCVPVLIGSLALVATASGERWLHVSFAISAPWLLAAALFRSPPLGLPLLLIVMLSLISFTITSRHLERNVLRVHSEFGQLIDSLDLAFWIAYTNDDVPHTIIGGLGRPVGRQNEFYEQPGAWRQVVHPDDIAGVDDANASSAAGSNHVSRYREQHIDGSYRWLEDTVTVEVDRDGTVVGTRGVRRDITESVHNRELARQFTEFVNALDQGVILTEVQDDLRVRVLALNDAILSMWPGDLTPLIGQTFGGFFRRAFGATPASDAVRQAGALVRSGTSGSVEIEVQLAGRDPQVIQLDVVPLANRTVAIVLSDITARVTTQRELARRASTDQLTGLANRVEFHERLRTALRDSVDQPVTIVLLDLDHFKHVNDSFGHHRGDELLIAVTQRMTEQLPDGAVLARLGGDEFAVMLATGETTADAVALAHRLTTAFNKGIVLDELRLHVGASMGIASAPEHADALETLIAHADVAMYLAKARGGGHAIYDATLDTSSTRRVLLLGDLRRALAMGEIICHFQPIADRDGNLVSAEALVRWQHPDLGMIMPGEFIDLAEVSSLSEPLAMTVLRNTLHQHELMHSVGIDLALSINLSPGNLMNLAFIEEVSRAITAASLPHGTLTVEITERTLSGRLSLMLPSLHKLRDLGVRIALDDFGAGQTSLALLRSLPLDQLKIDKLLVDDIASGSEAIVRSIVDLSHQLGLEVVAEGVETAEVRDRLIAIGCDRIQGYHVSRPIGGAHLLQLLRAEA